MSDVIITLNMLIDGLENKKELLDEILNYTKIQENLLLAEEFNLKSFNNIMKNKQVRIDGVMRVDQGFQPLYERIRSHIEKSPELYKEYITKLQRIIKITSDLNVEIQVIEQNNHMKFKQVSKGLRGSVKQFRSQKKNSE